MLKQRFSNDKNLSGFFIVSPTPFIILDITLKDFKKKAQSFF